MLQFGAWPFYYIADFISSVYRKVELLWCLPTYPVNNER